MYGPLVIEKQQELRNVKEHCKKVIVEAIFLNHINKIT